MRIPLFRIWYSTTYTTLFIILVLLLAIAPGDAIYQSVESREFQKLFIVGGAYLLTVLVVLLVYSTRLYTNRTVLQAIPKAYVPIEEGEVGKGIRRIVAKHLKRSAIIAWDCTPRDLRGEAGTKDEEKDISDGMEATSSTMGTKEKGKQRKKNRQHKKDHYHVPDTIIVASSQSPPWGHVSHPGWASPASPDFPDLKYSTVICELPNLIEAKAVSLAPPDPGVENDAVRDPGMGPPLPDAQTVALLQRPRAMGLREYLGRLADFGLLNPPSLGPAFLARYEGARFSTKRLTENEFRDMMAVFAAILNGMTALDPAAMEEARAQDGVSDMRSIAPTDSSSDGADNSASNSYLPFLTPQLDRSHSVSLHSSSSNENMHSDDGTQSLQSSLRFRHQGSASATPRALSERSLPSLSDGASVMIHSRQQQKQQQQEQEQEEHQQRRRSPSTILPNSSSSSSIIRHSPVS